jgi:hypothetical protein
MSLWSSVKGFVKKEAPMLLTLTGITGFVTGAVMAAKAAPAAQAADDLYWENEFQSGRIRLNKWDTHLQTAKNVFPYYAPAIGVMFISAASLLGSAHMSRTRYVAISILQAATQRYADNLRASVEKNTTRPKAEQIMTEAIQPTAPVPLNMLQGDWSIFWDDYSKRYFYAPTVETIKAVVNKLNEKLHAEDWIPLNDWYYELGLEPVGSGEMLGWDRDDGNIEMNYRPIMKDGKPVACVEFRLQPKYIYGSRDWSP